MGPSLIAHVFSFPSTIRWLLRSVPYTSLPLHPSIPYLTPSLENSCFLSLKSGKITRKSGSFKRWIGSYLDECIDSLLLLKIAPSFRCFLLITSFFFHFLQPKSLPPHWLNFSMSCLLPRIFDTCWRSKRGLRSSSSYLRDLSLPYSSPFIIALLCY